MSTIKQQKVAQEVIKAQLGESNDNAQKMLEKVGYSKGIAKNPMASLSLF